MNREMTTTQNGPRLPTPAPASVRSLLLSTAIQKRFEQVMGDKHKAAMFMASLSTLVYGNKRLMACEPDTVIAAALQAAAFDLPVDPNLGQAHIVPYAGQARLQIGWKGYVQLALRTAQYAALNVDHVYEGEVTIANRFTGEMKFAPPTSDTVVGVLAYLKLLNGFEKFVYWPLDKITAHAKRFSKSYGKADSGWTTHPEAMEKKTVLLDLLRKWGVMSIEMRNALATDIPPDEEPVPLMGSNAGDEAAKVTMFGTDPDAGAPADPPQTAVTETAAPVTEGEPPMPEPPPPDPASDEEMAKAVAQFDAEQAQNAEKTAGRRRR